MMYAFMKERPVGDTAVMSDLEEAILVTLPNSWHHWFPDLWIPWRAFVKGQSLTPLQKWKESGTLYWARSSSLDVQPGWRTLPLHGTWISPCNITVDGYMKTSREGEFSTSWAMTAIILFCIKLGFLWPVQMLKMESLGSYNPIKIPRSQSSCRVTSSNQK